MSSGYFKSNLKYAKEYEYNLGKKIQQYPPVNLQDSNPYIKYAKQLREGNIAYETKIQTGQKLKKTPAPPNIPKPKNQTPKINKFVKKGGKTFRKRNLKKNTQTKKNNKKYY